MAAPHPPQGNQSSHTERPLKVYGEQYLTGQPLPVGAVVDPVSGGDPAFPPIPLFSDGQPRVLLPTGWVLIHPTEWLLSNRYSGKPQEVISAEEFAERFGPSADLA